jgi:hypothetical protein
MRSQSIVPLFSPRHAVAIAPFSLHSFASFIQCSVGTSIPASPLDNRAIHVDLQTSRRGLQSTAQDPWCLWWYRIREVHCLQTLGFGTALRRSYWYVRPSHSLTHSLTHSAQPQSLDPPEISHSHSGYIRTKTRTLLLILSTDRVVKRSKT